MSSSPVDSRVTQLREEHLGPCPRRIYSLWLQGEAAAPDLVRLNWDRWSRLNPDYELVIFDLASALDRIGNFPIDLTGLSPQTFSDVLRAKLLVDEGGAWVDATVFPVIPLSEWIEACLDGCSFFAYGAPGEDRPISSWFLVARQNTLIMRAWWDALNAYWCKPRTIVLDVGGRIAIPGDSVAAVAPELGGLENRYWYYWFHYLFAYLCATNRPFQSAWERCSQKAASAPLRLDGFLGQHPDVTLEALTREAHSSEMHKLNWRAPSPVNLLARI